MDDVMEVLTIDGLEQLVENMKTYVAKNAVIVDGAIVEPSETNGNLKINGVETVIYTPQEYFVEY